MCIFKPMSLTGMDCEVKLTCANRNIGGCTARKMHCGTNFDPEVQIEDDHQSARFTCTNTNCVEVNPTTCAPAITCNTITVTTSVPYCETTHTTHSCEITITLRKSPLTNLLVMPCAHVLKP